MAPKYKRLKTSLAVLAALTVAAVLLYVIMVPRPTAVQTAKAKSGVFRETILSDGVLRSKERYVVPAFATGDIKRISLKVGDPVKKGQTVAEISWIEKYEPLRAPITGVVSKIFRESAGPVVRGEPLLEIVDPSDLEIVAELLTTDAVRLDEGALVLVENWRGGSPLPGKVRRISKAGFIKPSALGVEEERTEVFVELDGAAKEILATAGSNFHVDLTFLVAERPGSLVIPAGALFRDDAGWAVYVVEGGRARLRKVEVSGVSSEEAAVKAGLTEGETLIVYPGDLVKDGARVGSSR